MRSLGWVRVVAFGLACVAAIPAARSQVCATIPGGCPGSASPFCAAPPTIGNAAFGIGLPPLACLPATGPVALFASPPPLFPIPLAILGVPTVVPGCTIDVMLTFLVSFPPAILAAPIPPDPALAGVVLLFQAGCFDPVAVVFSVSGVLSVTVR